MKIRFLIPVVMTTFILGCGGGGNSAQTGRVRINFYWPSSAVMPAASNSIKFVIRRDNVTLDTKVISRPEGAEITTVEFQNLPVGDLTATASAHPQFDGTGASQAAGSVAFMLHAGRIMLFVMTMDSAIDRLEVSPSSVTLNPGQTLQLGVTARNWTHQIILISTGKLEWRSLNTTTATVSSTGEVSVLTPGSAEIRVIETESGKIASAHVQSAGSRIFTSGNIVVDVSDSSDLSELREFKRDGTLVQTLTLPYPGRRDGEAARDITFDDEGRLHVHNGIFNPFLSTLSPNGMWTHRTYPEWNSFNQTMYGGVAALGDRVLVTDQALFVGPSSGIIEFNLQSNSARRVVEDGDYFRIERGLDGLLYALQSGQSIRASAIDVYDPATMMLLRSVNVPMEIASVAANSAGEIFVLGAAVNPNVYKLSPDGTVIKSLNLGQSANTDLNLTADGTIAIIHPLYDARVHITNEDLFTVSSFPIGPSTLWHHSFGALVP